MATTHTGTGRPCGSPPAGRCTPVTTTQESGPALAQDQTANNNNDTNNTPSLTGDPMPSWELILTEADWTYDYNNAGASYWRAPNAATGVQASVRLAEDTITHLRGSNALHPAGTKERQTYSRYGAYALLHHDGDTRAATAKLTADGFQPPEDDQLKPDPTEASLEDSPMAVIMADILRGKYRWAGAMGWHRYNGSAWTEATEAALVESVRSTMARLHKKWVRLATDMDRARKLATLLGKPKIRAIAELLRGLLEIDPAEFDMHHDLLNTTNGTIHLPTGTLRPHNPADLLTKTTNAPYRPGYTHPDWTMALAALPVEVHAWLQVRVGQSVTGYPPTDDKMLFHQGGGSNGKSAVLNGCMATLGGYASIIPEKVLLASPGEHTTELTTLKGVRFAVIEELPEGPLNAKRIKDTVGTPLMTARRIRQDSITWEATHGLHISTNPTPRVRDTDWAVWRRMVLLQYPYTFISPDKEPQHPSERIGDPGLRDRLRTDPEVQAAILAWMVAGAVAWYAAGKTMPPEPEAVTAATTAWRDGQDLIGTWFAEHIEFDATAVISSKELLEDFTSWATGTGHAPWSDQTFTERFAKHPSIEGKDVKKVRRTNPSNLSRRMDLTPMQFGKVTVWTGLKFAGMGA